MLPCSPTHVHRLVAALLAVALVLAWLPTAIADSNMPVIIPRSRVGGAPRTIQHVAGEANELLSPMPSPSKPLAGIGDDAPVDDVYALTIDGDFHAVNVQTGDIQWSTALGNLFMTAPDLGFMVGLENGAILIPSFGVSEVTVDHLPVLETEGHRFEIEDKFCRVVINKHTGDIVVGEDCDKQVPLSPYLADPANLLVPYTIYSMYKYDKDDKSSDPQCYLQWTRIGHKTGIPAASDLGLQIGTVNLNHLVLTTADRMLDIKFDTEVASLFHYATNADIEQIPLKRVAFAGRQRADDVVAQRCQSADMFVSTVVQYAGEQQRYITSDSAKGAMFNRDSDNASHPKEGEMAVFEDHTFHTGEDTDACAADGSDDAGCTSDPSSTSAPDTNADTEAASRSPPTVFHEVEDALFVSADGIQPNQGPRVNDGDTEFVDSLIDTVTNIFRLYSKEMGDASGGDSSANSRRGVVDGGNNLSDGSNTRSLVVQSYDDDDVDEDSDAVPSRGHQDPKSSNALSVVVANNGDASPAVNMPAKEGGVPDSDDTGMSRDARSMEKDKNRDKGIFGDMGVLLVTTFGVIALASVGFAATTYYQYKALAERRSQDAAEPSSSPKSAPAEVERTGNDGTPEEPRAHSRKEDDSVGNKNMMRNVSSSDKDGDANNNDTGDLASDHLPSPDMDPSHPYFEIRGALIGCRGSFGGQDEISINDSLVVDLSKLLGKGSDPTRVYGGRLLQENVAVKMCMKDKYSLNEVKSFTRLSHENIVRYHQAVDLTPPPTHTSSELPTYTCLVMERALTSVARVNPEHPLNKKSNAASEIFRKMEMIDIAQGMLEGIKYLHSENVVHRDVKEQNLLIVWANRRNKLLKVVLADFGISKVIKDPDTNGVYTHTHGVGCAGRMAPEQMDKGRPKCTKKTDIFQASHVIDFLARHTDHLKPTDEPLLRNQYSIQNLIQRMGEYDARDRISAKEALQHPYFWDLDTLERCVDRVSHFLQQEKLKFMTTKKSEKLTPNLTPEERKDAEALYMHAQEIMEPLRLTFDRMFADAKCRNILLQPKKGAKYVQSDLCEVVRLWRNKVAHAEDLVDLEEPTKEKVQRFFLKWFPELPVIVDEIDRRIVEPSLAEM